MALFYERYSLKSLDKTVQEGHRDSLLGTITVCVPVIMSHHCACVEISQAFSLRFCEL